jgi:ribosomal-protein-alanine N-acetyltransferase
MNLEQAPPPQPTPVPTLHTARLVIRPLRESDVPAIQRNFQDYETVRFLAAAVPWPYPQDGASTWFKNIVQPGQGTANWSWAICHKETPDQLIGVLELFREGRPSHRGFWLDRRFWGNGYMHEAVEVVNDYAFDVLGYERLMLDNAVGNTRSSRIKEKTGARFIEIAEAKFVDPSVTKIERWELTKEAWHKVRGRAASE